MRHIRGLIGYEGYLFVTLDGTILLKATTSRPDKRVTHSGSFYYATKKARSIDIFAPF